MLPLTIFKQLYGISELRLEEQNMGVLGTEDGREVEAVQTITLSFIRSLTNLTGHPLNPQRSSQFWEYRSEPCTPSPCPGELP